MQIITKYLEKVPLLTTYILNLGDVKVVIDPGPASLHSPLDVDAVLCTHIHLDHCGSAGHINSPVYVHERYTKYVTEPLKLYEASKTVLGIFAEKFGAPLPSRQVVGVRDQTRLFDVIDVIYTPGHAPHHVVYYERDNKTLFIGDGGGVYIPELGVIVPTTPPPFKLDIYLQSLHRIKSLDVDTVCFPHYSCTRNVEILKVHEQQIRSWAETLKDVDVPIDEALRLLARVDENVAKILTVGGFYAEFYLKISVLGFLNYLKSQRAAS